MVYDGEFSLRYVACPYKDCFYYRKPGQKTITWWSQKQGRYKCRICNRTFRETTGSFFDKKRHSPETIVEVLLLLTEGMSIRGIARVKKIKPATIIKWRREAIHHLEELESYLLNDLELSQVQLDEIWTFLKKIAEKENGKRPLGNPKTSCGSGMR